MSDLPEMKPSSEERFDACLDNGGNCDQFNGIAAIERAFRDGVAAGALAERKRIAALLRAEADAQFHLSPGFVIEHAQAICTTLRSIADRIETEGKGG